MTLHDITLHYMYTGAGVYTICAYSTHFKTTHFGVQQFCAARGQNFVAADATRRGSRFRGRPWVPNPIGEFSWKILEVG